MEPMRYEIYYKQGMYSVIGVHIGDDNAESKSVYWVFPTLQNAIDIVELQLINDPNAKYYNSFGIKIV